MKVPVGKHCGFVQFVRKPDAERAIEKMQGFPIGGSRIRLSWGRSQCTLFSLSMGAQSLMSLTDKAAQAAAQAAQAAAFQAQYHQVQMAPPNAPTLTAEQAMQLLEKFGITQFLNSNGTANNQTSSNLNVDAMQAATAEQVVDLMNQYDAYTPSSFEQRSGFNASSFSPFSPDPNYLADLKNREGASSVSPGQSQSFSSTSSKGYAPWYSSSDDKPPGTNTSGKVSPTGSAAHHSRPNSARAFGNFLGDAQPHRTSSRGEGFIAKPDLSRRPSQGMASQEQHFIPGQHDPIHDLNGTLASLNLDNQGLWKSGNEGPHSTSS